MPVVIKRSDSAGQPAKGGSSTAKGGASTAKKGVAKSTKSGGSKQAQTGLAALDDRTKLIGLGVVIAVALVAILIFTSGFGLWGGGASLAPGQPLTSHSTGALGVDTTVPGGRSAPTGATSSEPGVSSATPRGADRRDNTPGGSEGEGIN